MQYSPDTSSDAGGKSVHTPNARLGLRRTEVKWVLLILVQCFLFEIVFFDYPEFLGDTGGSLVNGAKLLIPLLLFVACGVPSLRFLWRIPQCAGYFLAIGLFAVWLLFACVISFDPGGAFFNWLKFAPRILFAVGAVGCFLLKPAVFEAIKRVYVIWGVLMVAQFIVLNLTAGYNYIVEFDGVDARFAGPFGLLGNVTSLTEFPGIPFPIPRLCGFWHEPSNASGSLFVAFFLARNLVAVGASKKWAYAGWCCFIGGFACLSNAGYLAIGAAACVGLMISRQQSFRLLVAKMVIFPLTFILLLGGLFGRKFVAENMPDNQFAVVIFGVRELRPGEEHLFDVTSGRIDIAQDAIATALVKPLGLGLISRTTSNAAILASATAPIFWLQFAGFPGLILLLHIEGGLFLAGYRRARTSRVALAVMQAWVALLAQQLCTAVGWIQRA